MTIDENLEIMFPDENMKREALKTMIGAAATMTTFISMIGDYIQVPKEVTYQMALTASYLAPLVGIADVSLSIHHEEVTFENFEDKYKKLLKYIVALNQSFEEK